MTIGHNTKFLFGVFILIFVTWTAGFLLFASMTQKMKAPESYIHTDAIVVLTGGKDRVNTGLDLLQEDSAEKILISGVNEKVTLEEILSLWGGHIDNPGCCIYLGHTAKNTTQNAAETSRWVEQMNIHSLRLVTSGYHMPRALMEFRHALPATEILPHPVKTHDMLNTVKEYHKTVLTWLHLNFGLPVAEAQ